MVRDHPRGCGEHNFQTTQIRTNIGSSPRMRGARSMTGIIYPLLGIIPADAGSTLYAFVANWYSKDHPRGCGEH